MRKMMLLIFALISFVANSANLYSIGNGNWNDPTKWSYTSNGAPCGCVPNPNVDNIHVETDITMTSNIVIFNSLTVSGNLHTLTYNMDIKGGATLEVSGTLEVNNLKFFNGSFINVTSTGVIIVHGNLDNANNSDNVMIEGSISVSGTFNNGNGGDIIGSGSITASSFTGTGTTFGYTNEDIPPGTVSTGSLPITLLSFEIICNGNNSRTINWTTSSENNTNLFIIQSSYDGVFWVDIDTVQASYQSNTNKTYSITDNTNYGYPNIIYYQLYEVDIDGYTQIFWMNSSHCELTNIPEIYPNPINFGESLYISEYVKNIEVYDILGRQATCIFRDGEIEGLSSGLYLIITDGVKKYKIIVK